MLANGRRTIGQDLETAARRAGSMWEPAPGAGLDNRGCPVGILVAACLTVWTPAMGSRRPRHPRSTIRQSAWCLAPALTITSSFRPLPTDRTGVNVCTDDRGTRVNRPDQQGAPRYDILTVSDSFTWGLCARERGHTLSQARARASAPASPISRWRAMARPNRCSFSSSGLEPQAQARGLRNHRRSLRAQRLGLRTVLLRVLPRPVPSRLEQR